MKNLIPIEMAGFWKNVIPFESPELNSGLGPKMPLAFKRMIH
jgi:hypothetical protein